MAKKIIWSNEAIKSFDDVLGYLKENWTEKEIDNFILQTGAAVDLISEFPFMFRKYNKHNIRAALITKHNLLVYKVYRTQIIILNFWDTRQNPSKKKGFKKSD
jgi:plasmid stabilization system protein ParE